MPLELVVRLADEARDIGDQALERRRPRAIPPYEISSLDATKRQGDLRLLDHHGH
jgi:hypothetical protein